MGNRIRAIGKLARPINCAIAAGTVLFSAWVVERSLSNPLVWQALVVVVLITAGANTINDYFDLPTDQINRPNRPIPAGLIAPNIALWVGLAEIIIALVFSFILPRSGVIIAWGTAILLLVYSPYLKRLPFIGNLTVSLASALAFIFTGVVLGKVKPVIYPAVVAFLFHLGRELLKDVQDAVGDHSSGYRTLPLVWGISATTRLVQFIFVALAIFLFSPLLWQGYSAVYYILVLLGVIPIMLYAVWAVSRYSQDFQRLERASVALKGAMVVGLLAIALGL